MTFGRNIQNTLEYSLHVSVFVKVCFFFNFFLRHSVYPVVQISEINGRSINYHKPHFWGSRTAAYIK